MDASEAKEAPIGVFDSGVGGLTVLKALMRRLPNERFVYFGDTARLPYGNKSHSTILRYSFENTLLLLQEGVKYVVVACNSASSVSIDELERCFRLPVTGVIRPGAQEAARISRSGEIAVTGTSATVGSGAYRRALLEIRRDVVIHEIACPLFVPLVEENWIDDGITRTLAERYLAPLRQTGTDTLILGCTHYPLLAGVISSVLPGVELVDPGEAVAEEVARTLDELSLASPPAAHRTEPVSAPIEQRCRFLLSDADEHFSSIAAKVLELPHPPRVETRLPATY